MAGDDDDKTVSGVVELEVMSREDSSWHPCHVSLCPSGAALVVTYGNNDLEDTFVSEEETLAHIRVRSNPLQGDDCAHIEQGEHVLAAQKSQSSFFDAQVEKAMRVRHSKKLHCRCTFVVKWLHQDPKGGISIVPSSSIMKLAKESINDHPTISAFLNAVRTESPLRTFDNDMDSELDLHELLGKQIEEISNSADASKKVIKKDLLLGFEVHTKGQIQRRPAGASNLIRSHIEVAPVQNDLRRSTRRSNKLQTEIEVKKDPPAAVPSVKEELPENTSPANPLAARAALASFMSMLPKNLELVFNHDEGEECFINSSDITSDKLVNLESLNVIEYFSSSVVNNFSTTVNSSKTAAEPFVPEPDNIVKSLFSTAKASGTSIVLDVSSTGRTNESEKGNKTPEVTNSGADFTHSMVEKNLSQPRKATRLTRAAVLKVTDIPVDNVERKLKSPTKARRVTRSAPHTAAKIETVETEGVFNEKMTKRVEIATSEHNFMTHASNVSVDAIASSVDSEIDSLPTKERKCPMEIEQRNKTDIEKKCASEIENVSNTRWLTRSLVHKETADKTMRIYERPAKNEFPPNTDSSGGTVGALDSNLLEKKGPTALSFHAEIRLPLTEERNTKRKTPGHLKATQETEGNISSFNGGSQGLKRKSTSSLKHELRSSPRLRFLPQTRSQRKH